MRRDETPPKAPRGAAASARRAVRTWTLPLAGLLLAWLPLDAARAAAPDTMPVQGVVRDNAGNVVEQGRFRMTFHLYPAQDASDPVWTESHPQGNGSCVSGSTPSGCVEVASGTFTARLGSAGEPLSPELFRDHGELWLGISVEGEPELPRRRLGSVGWAMAAGHAERAALADDLSCSGCVDGDDVAFDSKVWTVQDDGDVVRTEGRVGIGTDDPGVALEVSGTVEADGFVATGDGNALDLQGVLSRGNDAGGMRVRNLGAPQAGSDAATRGYVDANALGGLDCASDQMPRFDGSAWRCMDGADTLRALVETDVTVGGSCGGGDRFAITSDDKAVYCDTSQGQWVLVASAEACGVGSRAFTTPGRYTWKVPPSACEVHALAVGAGGGGGGCNGGGGGGGGLRYGALDVEPGDLVDVRVGQGGYGGKNSNPGGAGGDSRVGSIVARGGQPGAGDSSSGGSGGCGSGGAGGGCGGSGGYHQGGGGGAAGYTGDGGNGGGNGSDGSGGGGGGGRGSDSSTGGGGVGLTGQGVNGEGDNDNSGGGGGSGGEDAENLRGGERPGTDGGAYGGGGGAGDCSNGEDNYHAGRGGHGAVRIIWGGGRSFPGDAF